jgi:hypothetical protein
MRTIAAPFLIFTFTLLSLLHFYWAAGGRRGFAQALPQRPGLPVKYPPTFLILIVALGLSGCGFIVSDRIGYTHTLPTAFARVASGILAAVFFLRAIGEFRYAGFFKKIKGTDFSRRDTWVYSPLCIIVAGCLVLIAL